MLLKEATRAKLYLMSKWPLMLLNNLRWMIHVHLSTTILTFSYKYMRLKCRLCNGGHFVSASMCYNEAYVINTNELRKNWYDIIYINLIMISKILCYRDCHKLLHEHKRLRIYGDSAYKMNSAIIFKTKLLQFCSFFCPKWAHNFLRSTWKIIEMRRAFCWGKPWSKSSKLINNKLLWQYAVDIFTSVRYANAGNGEHQSIQLLQTHTN